MARAWSVDAYNWNVDRLPKDVFPGEHKMELLASKSRIAVWLWRCVVHPDPDIWKAIQELEPELTARLWSVFFNQTYAEVQAQPERLCYWTDLHDALHVITPHEWKVLTSADEIRGVLTDPGPEWQLSIERHWD